MSYAQENGYTPITFNDFMNSIRLGINAQFATTYTEDNFVGTNWYKYFYALVQKALENETKTSEIFAKLQQYIETTNLRIQRPSVSMPGMIDSFTQNGYIACVKRNLIGDAGTISVCVDVDNTDPDYPETRLAICTLLSQFIVGGLVTLGTEEEEITLSNGQQFDYKFFLPDETDVLLRLTLTTSDNQLLTVPSDEVIRDTLFNQLNERYRLGWDFEPQRYFTIDDAPWAATAVLEWSSNAGVNWHPEVFEASFDDVFRFTLDDISVVVDP